MEKGYSWNLLMNWFQRDINMNVTISDSEYLQLLLNTNKEHQDLYWVLRTKLQIKKMQNISGFNLESLLNLVDSRFREITETPNQHKNIWSKTTKYPTESVTQSTGILKPRNSLRKRVRNSKSPRTNSQRYVYRNTFRRWDCLGVKSVPFESRGKECDPITINSDEVFTRRDTWDESQRTLLSTQTSEVDEGVLGSGRNRDWVSVSLYLSKQEKDT